MPPLKRMAKRIQQFRAQRGLSQEQLAERAGISRPYLARLETGRQDPRVSVLLKIARGLRVGLSELIE
jgi:transcriptional regulator with XRE-family HTH domain